MEISHLSSDLPCVFPLDAVLIYEKSHKLGNTDNRVSIVKLDYIVLSEIMEIVAVSLLILSDDILQ